MKNKREIFYHILNNSVQNQMQYPELSKYIGDIPFKISDKVGNEITIQNIREYYESLDALLKNFEMYLNISNKFN